MQEYYVQQNGYSQYGAPQYPMQQDAGPMQNGVYQQQEYYGHEEYYEDANEPLVVSLVVPEGVAPGAKLQYDAPDGQELRLTVPPGVPPGSVMTLTQDPVTKQWKCMAEPADGQEGMPPPQQQEQPPYEDNHAQQHYHPSASPYTIPASHDRSIAAQPMPQARAAPIPQQASTITTYAAAQAPRIVSKSTVVQPLPVNLSYVPPPAAASTSMQMAPGQVILAGQQRPSYTPPPVSIVDRPSYTPLPQGMQAGQPMPMAAPATLASDPSQFNPPRQIPYMVQDGLEQRPSYTPPPILPQIGQPVVGQTASYVPPPMPVIRNSPSYVPPPAMPMMPVVQRSPSFVPPPAAITMAPPVTYAAPTPDVMGTTTSVTYPAQCNSTASVPMDPTSVQFHQHTALGMPASTMGAPMMGTMPGAAYSYTAHQPQPMGIMPSVEYGVPGLSMMQPQVQQYGAPAPPSLGAVGAAPPMGSAMQPQIAPGGMQAFPGMAAPMFQTAPAPCPAAGGLGLYAPPQGGMPAMAMQPPLGMQCQPQIGLQMPGLLGVGTLQTSQAPGFAAPYPQQHLPQ